MSHSGRKIKNTFVSGNAGDRKNLHSGDRKFFFFQPIFRRYYFFFFSFYCFFVLLFFCFCLYVSFLKLKICILVHIQLCGRVSDKNFFTLPISWNKTTFFGLSVWVGSRGNNFLNITLVSVLSNSRYITILRIVFYMVNTVCVPKISDLNNPRF